MRHVLRRAPLSLSQGSPAAPPQGLPDGFLLQLLSPADEPRREERARPSAGKSHRQRNQFLSQSSATRSFAKECPRRIAAEKAGTPRLDLARMERRMFFRAGGLLRSDPDLRRARVLLPAKSAS